MEDRTGLWVWGLGARSGRETERSQLYSWGGPHSLRETLEGEARNRERPASSWNFPEGTTGRLGETPSWPGTQVGCDSYSGKGGDKRVQPQLPPDGAQDAGG